MAVTFDAAGSGNTTSTGATSLSWSHTVNASATLLLAAVSLDETNVAPVASWVSITANSTSMTQFASSPVENTFAAGLWIFYLFSPPTGSVTLDATISGGADTTETDATIGGSLSFLGAATLGTPVTVPSNSGTTITLTCTGVASTSMVAGFINAGDDIPSPTTGDQQFVQNVKGSAGGTDGNEAGATNTGSGSVSISWTTFPSGDTNSGWAVEVKAAAAAGAAALPGRQLPNWPAYQVFTAGPSGKAHSV